MTNLAPDCMAALKRARADGASLAALGRRLATPAKPGGYSAPTINQLLAGTYPSHNFSEIECAIRAALLAATVECPAFGEAIDLALCLEHQRHARAGTNASSFRVMMARICPTCPNRNGGPHVE